MIDTKFIKCDKLTTEANKIFKGLIKAAYIKFENEEQTKENSFWESHIKNNANRKDYFENRLDVDKQKELRYDCETVVFEFINGAIVEFSNSEWAAMEVCNKSNLL